jgi:hypothetical protein
LDYIQSEIEVFAKGFVFSTFGSGGCLGVLLIALALRRVFVLYNMPDSFDGGNWVGRPSDGGLPERDNAGPGRKSQIPGLFQGCHFRMHTI